MADPNANVKVAPHSKDSEMMVLGCMLTSINALNIGADYLDDSDFYYTEHKIIFSVLKKAYKDDKPADVHLVCEELKRQEKLKAVGGVSYITMLAQYAGTSAYLEEYAEIIRDKSVLRSMIQAAQSIEKTALEEPGDVNSVLDEAQQMFFRISQSTSKASGVLIGDVLSGVKSEKPIPFLKELQAKQERFQEVGPEEAGIVGVPSSFKDLDRMLNGLGDSNLIILAARPAMGKTALAINLAENVCFKAGHAVGVFSLEMSADQLVHRIVCSQAEVESEKIKTGSLNGMEYQRIVAAVNEMQKHTMIIDDQPGLSITDLRARARRMKETYDIRLLVVDYLQLISGSGSNRTQESRQNEISEISRMLKNLAREVNIPVICLSQLSRKVEERAGHRPMMSDLRESGCLTGDAEIQDAETGKVYTIEALAQRKKQTPIWVHAVDEERRMGKYRMTKAFYSGRKEVFQLSTRNGQQIKASANHPFLTKDGWKRLDELSPGCQVGIPEWTLSSHQASSGVPHPDRMNDHSPTFICATERLGQVKSLPTLLIHGNLSLHDNDFETSNAPMRVLKEHHLNQASLDGRIHRAREEEAGLPLDTAAPPHLRARLRHGIEVLPSPESTGDVFWDDIVSIEALGETDVYDATVEEVHNFVANGIVVHNSIEQDADQVLFLLRREYYDPLDKPGMAELIIGKNRHGAVGSVNLTFRKEIAQFADYAPITPDLEGLDQGVPDEAFEPFTV